MLRVASNQTLIVPPFECAWLSLADYGLHGAFCLHFDCQGENDVTIILKPVAGAKRWQHLSRQAGAEGGALAVECNYTVILGSHRNSKLKIEKNGEEKAAATGLAGCSAVSPASFSSCWISYSAGTIAVGTGPPGGTLALSFVWQDPDPPIPDIQHVGLSCWDKHVSYRHVQLLPPLPVHGLLQEAAAAAAAAAQAQPHAAAPHDAQHTLAVPACGGAAAPAAGGSKHGLLLQLHEAAASAVPPLLQLMQHCVVAHLQPRAVCHVLQLAEALLPRTQHLYEAAVAAAGEWFRLLVAQHLQELAMVPLDVLVDVLHEPLLDVSELDVFQAVAAWCQGGAGTGVSDDAAAAASVHDDQPCDDAAAAADDLPGAGAPAQQLQPAPGVDAEAAPAAAARVVEVLQLVRFAFMSEQEQQAVLAHPFTQACPLVQQALQADLQRLQDCTNGAPGPSHAAGSFQCQHRRLVLPAAVGAEAAAGGTGMATTAADGNDAAEAAEPSGVVHVPRSGGSSLSSSSVSSRRGAPGCAWPRRRLAPSCKELMFVFHGDRNGAIHHIATEYGTKPWVNPVLSKAVDIKASSPPSRHTDAKAIVSGQFLNTSFAGPRYVRPAAAAEAAAVGSSTAAAAAAAPLGSSTPSTWWQLDLGPQHRLLCNYYVMRHDGSHEGFARSWVLQGSNDLHTWLDLRRHRGDSTIRLPGQYGSWPVTGPAASMPFRAFRLLLLEPTQSPTHPWAFCLSYLELYGYFMRR